LLEGNELGGKTHQGKIFLGAQGGSVINKAAERLREQLKAVKKLVFISGGM
jgi:hypothetical protein